MNVIIEFTRPHHIALCALALAAPLCADVRAEPVHAEPVESVTTASPSDAVKAYLLKFSSGDLEGTLDLCRLPKPDPHDDVATFREMFARHGPKLRDWGSALVVEEEIIGRGAYVVLKKEGDGKNSHHTIYLKKEEDRWLLPLALPGDDLFDPPWYFLSAEERALSRGIPAEPTSEMDDDAWAKFTDSYLAEADLHRLQHGGRLRAASLNGDKRKRQRFYGLQFWETSGTPESDTAWSSALKQYPSYRAETPTEAWQLLMGGLAKGTTADCLPHCDLRLTAIPAAKPDLIALVQALIDRQEGSPPGEVRFEQIIGSQAVLDTTIVDPLWQIAHAHFYDDVGWKIVIPRPDPKGYDRVAVREDISTRYLRRVVVYERLKRARDSALATKSAPPAPK